jgi:aryl-alcohol dehydrogenase-like predicted oxidoreductase
MADTQTSFERGVLGRTGLPVGRLGLAAGYGVPAAAVEKAVECGVNYLFWGSRRTKSFGDALKAMRSQRERLILVLQSYSRGAGLMQWSLERALRAIGYDYTDVLLLGWWNRPVTPKIMDAALELKRRGLVRHLAVSTHHRPFVEQAAAEFDIVHFRYNAAHPGAEQDVFPLLHETNRPGMVSFTATSWSQLLGKNGLQNRVMGGHGIPESERTPKGVDCYRFVLGRPEVDVCLTGPATAEQMEEALEALRLGPLNEEEDAWMRRVGRSVAGK